ncbi:MAG: hypothetical protein EOP10_00535 [Proteobacteria bacterium]|nr:MAG: hypothetical protein EOP10_00535 [Pseudomonadota bacterium]
MKPQIKLLPLVLIVSGYTGCKSTGQSSVQSLSFPQDGNFTQEDWVKACEADLQKPGEGESNRKDLIELSGTDDCRESYPTVKSLLTRLTRKSQ